MFTNTRHIFIRFLLMNSRYLKYIITSYIYAIISLCEVHYTVSGVFNGLFLYYIFKIHNTLQKTKFEVVCNLFAIVLSFFIDLIFFERIFLTLICLLLQRHISFISPKLSKNFIFMICLHIVMWLVIGMFSTEKYQNLLQTYKYVLFGYFSIYLIMRFTHGRRK